MSMKTQDSSTITERTDFAVIEMRQSLLRAVEYESFYSVSNSRCWRDEVLKRSGATYRKQLDGNAIHRGGVAAGVRDAVFLSRESRSSSGNECYPNISQEAQREWVRSDNGGSQ
ncbi:hypothetical protein MRX96_013275 [Rhipicephalus microplus]